MATSRSLPWIARTIVVGAASALSLTLVPATGGIAHAEPGAPPPVNLPTPRTPEQAKAQINQLNEQLETVTEQFNQATEDLGAKRKAQVAAQQQITQLNGQLQAMAGKVRQMASSVYRSAPLSEFTTMMTSKSPDQFLQQMAGLAILGKRRSTTLAALNTAKARADEARIAAQKAAGEVQATVDSLNAKKRWIEQQLPKQQALLASLTSDQREEFLGSGGEWPDLPPPSGKAAVVLEAAKSKLGSPYVWGAEGPSTFDCSGYTLWSFAQAGISLPRTSAAQSGVGIPVPRSQLAPGDLVFFYSPVHHVGIYVGDGLMAHAPHPGDVVKIASISTMPFTGGRRLA